jgi:hypothetical protein
MFRTIMVLMMLSAVYAWPWKQPAKITSNELPKPSYVDATKSVIKWATDDEEFDAAKYLSRMSEGRLQSTDQCFQALAGRIQSSCDKITEAQSMRFALELTNCNLANSHHDTYDCPGTATDVDSIGWCVHEFTESHHLIYTYMKNSVTSLCEVMQSKLLILASKETMIGLVAVTSKMIERLVLLANVTTDIHTNVGDMAVSQRAATGELKLYMTGLFSQFEQARLTFQKFSLQVSDQFQGTRSDLSHLGGTIIQLTDTMLEKFKTAQEMTIRLSSTIYSQFLNTSKGMALITDKATSIDKGMIEMGKRQQQIAKASLEHMHNIYNQTNSISNQTSYIANNTERSLTELNQLLSRLTDFSDALGTLGTSISTAVRNEEILLERQSKINIANNDLQGSVDTIKLFLKATSGKIDGLYLFVWYACVMCVCSFLVTHVERLKGSDIFVYSGIFATCFVEWYGVYRFSDETRQVLSSLLHWGFVICLGAGLTWWWMHFVDSGMAARVALESNTLLVTGARSDITELSMNMNKGFTSVNSSFSEIQKGMKDLEWKVERMENNIYEFSHTLPKNLTPEQLNEQS